MLPLLFITPTPFQIVLVLILGVLFFGKNLPEVARQIGLSLLEFKKGMGEVGTGSKSFAGKAEHSDLLDREVSAKDETDKHDIIGAKFEPPNT